MHEDLAAVFAGEKSIPLVGVVPLDLAGRHAQTSRIPERTDNQRSGDRQDAMGSSKAIGPGRVIAATLWPAPVPRGRAGPLRSGGPASHGRWCWDGFACEAGFAAIQDRIGAIPSGYAQKQLCPETRRKTARGQGPGPF